MRADAPETDDCCFWSSVVGEKEGIEERERVWVLTSNYCILLYIVVH